MKQLRLALASTDARAIEIEEKHHSMVQLVEKMKQDRKHHNEIIAECKRTLLIAYVSHLFNLRISTCCR